MVAGAVLLTGCVATFAELPEYSSAPEPPLGRLRVEVVAESYFRYPDGSVTEEARFLVPTEEALDPPVPIGRETPAWFRLL
jgi:hypothetical protein